MAQAITSNTISNERQMKNIGSWGKVSKERLQEKQSKQEYANLSLHSSLIRVSRDAITLLFWYGEGHPLQEIPLVSVNISFKRMTSTLFSEPLKKSFPNNLYAKEAYCGMANSAPLLQPHF